MDHFVAMGRGRDPKVNAGKGKVMVLGGEERLECGQDAIGVCVGI